MCWDQMASVDPQHFRLDGLFPLLKKKILKIIFYGFIGVKIQAGFIINYSRLLYIYICEAPDWERDSFQDPMSFFFFLLILKEIKLTAVSWVLGIVLMVPNA